MEHTSPQEKKKKKRESSRESRRVYLKCFGKKCLAGRRENRQQLLKGPEGRAQLKVKGEVGQALDVGHKGSIVIGIEPGQRRREK